MKKVFLFKRGNSRFIIPFSDIVYMEKNKREITVHTVQAVNASAESISFYGKIKDIMPLLDERFASPHGSYVLNMDYYREVGNSRVLMEGGKEITMCKACYSRCINAFDSYTEKYTAKVLAKA